MNPGIDLGPFRLHYYGLILGLAIFTAYFFARYRLKKSGKNPKVMDDVLLFSVPLAIIFARIYYVVFSWAEFREQQQSIFAIWEGGIAIHGALIGGLLGVIIALYIAKKRGSKDLSLGGLLDAIAPALLLAQAIGRLGNFVNQEAFGSPTNLPWRIFIEAERRPPGFEEFEYYHPTFAYEAIWNLIGVVLLLLLEKRGSLKRFGSGAIFAGYIIWYSIGRFFIEALRTDSLYWGNLRVAQLVSISAVLGGLVFIWYRKSHAKTTK